MERIIEEWPLETATFFSRIFLSGTLTNALVLAAGLRAFLAEGIAADDTPQAVWLFVRAAVFAVQTPWRMRLLATFRAAAAAERAEEARAMLLEAMASEEWRKNRELGMALYAWFSIGVGLLLHGAGPDGGPLRHVCLLSVALFAAHVVVSFCWMTAAFDRVLGAGGAPFGPQSRRPRLSGAEIDKHTESERYRHQGAEEDAACAICYKELAEGDLVRRLRCGHRSWHAGCVDEWLQIQQRCPLCQTSLAPPPADG